MTDEGDEGARVGLWVVVGATALVVLGLLGGLAMRQVNKAPKAKPAATAAVAAPAAAETLLEGPITGDLLAKLTFEVGGTALPADAAATLADVQAKLAQAPAGANLVLSGFHDPSGDPAKNAELAKERAKAVRAALVAAGVDVTRVALRKPESTMGGGTPEEARRVEVRLVP